MIIQATSNIAKPKSKNGERNVPVVIKWKGQNMVRQHSFLSTVSEIIAWSLDSDVTKIGIVGEPSSGKSTLAEALAHAIHKRSKIPFAVRVFSKEQLMDFKGTLGSLQAANHILVFDDLSFLGADATKKQIDIIKQAETTIRHLPGGQDVKIILIYNYHYTLGLDKYLRQAHFFYYTTIGSQERENMVNFLGKKYQTTIEKFRQFRVQAVSHKHWIMKIGPKEPFVYKYRNPFIPVLFYNNLTLRFIVSPTRQWMDEICATCTVGKNHTVDGQTLDEVMKSAEQKYSKKSLVGALKLKLFVNGMTAYGRTTVQILKYIDKILAKRDVSLEDMANYYKLEITKARLRLKPGDPLYEPPT
mgnify:CR=1 FL=1